MGVISPWPCFDLDNFKPFNDTFGHQEGDNILRFVSSTMRGNLRHQDQAFRLGGDEFAFVLVETDLEHGRLAVERFRKSPSTIPGRPRCPIWAGYLSPVTVSTGVAQLDEGEKADKLFMRADSGHVRSKKGRRQPQYHRPFADKDGLARIFHDGGAGLGNCINIYNEIR